MYLFDADPFTVTTTFTDVTFDFEYTSEEFIISNSTTFSGKGIIYGVDIAYNVGTDIGYTAVAQVDVDSILLDGIFGAAPQQYKIVQHVTDVSVPSMVELEFNGTEWVIISQTTLGL